MQEGSLAEVTAHPRSSYVGDLVGINVVRSRVEHCRLLTDEGEVIVSTDVDVSAGPAFAAIRPSSIALHREPPSGSARNVWACTVEPRPARRARARRARGTGPVDRRDHSRGARRALGLRPGDAVHASVKATEVTVYAA